MRAVPLRASGVSLAISARQGHRHSREEVVPSTVLDIRALGASQIEDFRFQISPIPHLTPSLNAIMIPYAPVVEDLGDGVGGFGNNGPPRLQPREGSRRGLELTALRALLNNTHA